MSLDPAKTLVDYLGGAKVVAAIVGKHMSNVYRWSYPFESGGGGGLVPVRDQRKILDHCQQAGIDLVPADFHNADRIRAISTRLEAAE